MAAFSTTDAAIITHEVELDAAAQSATAAASGRSIYHVYDILSTATKIVEGRFRHVALQFPDEALIDSVPVYWALKRETRALYRSSNPDIEEQDAAEWEKKLPSFYVLADTSYGSCCVDEVAAQHVNADLVVHYGHACLSPTARLPVIYVFPKQPIDVDHAASSLADASLADLFHGISDPAAPAGSSSTASASTPSALVLSYDVAWAHAADETFRRLEECLRQRGIKVPLIRTEIDTRRNYEEKLASGLSRDVGALSMQDRDQADGPCRQTSSTSSCCRASPREASSSSTAVPPSSSACCGGGCTSASASSSVPPPRPSPSQPPSQEKRSESPLGPSKSLHLPDGVALSDCAFLYLGPESLSLTNLLLLLGPTTPFLSYNPHTRSTRLETGSTNRLLMKRYTHVLKARDAAVVGLLVGTLGVHAYLPLLSRLRSKLTAKGSGRKVYTISVGKLNPAKLANFQEVDLFVLIACPENSLVDSKDFFRPIVTPFEMELALQAGNGDDVRWTGEYVLELGQLLGRGGGDARGDDEEHEDGEGARQPPSSADGADAGRQDDEEDEDEDRPHFSLITGSYVSRTRYGGTGTTPSDDDAAATSTSRALLPASSTNGGGAESHTVALRNADGTMTTILQSASTAHLEKRGWKGLEQRLGLDAPSRLEEGREGIARGYRESDGTAEGTT